MKLFIAICCFVFISSCKKTESSSFTNTGLIGKWRYSETYDGYANGGSFSWKQVDTASSHTFEFAADNKFSKKEGSGGNYLICNGTYRQIAADTVEITSTCQSVVQKIKISELTNQTLILDYQVREGTIRDKYVAVK